MFYVIDAGVAVKWFIPEVDSDIAHQLLARYLQGVDTPIAPDLFIAECGNVFWRRCRQGDITPDEATESLADLLTLNVPLVPATRLYMIRLKLSGGGILQNSLWSRAVDMGLPSSEGWRVAPGWVPYLCKWTVPTGLCIRGAHATKGIL